MAKTYSKTGYASAPTITLSLVAGGTLTANTTYYYRAMTSQGLYAGGDYVSAPSAVQSITTDAVNRSIKIDIVHVTGIAEYTHIWVNEGSDPSTGNWGRRDLYPNIYQLGATNTSIQATSTSKIITFTDDGTRATNNRLGTGNYGMYMLRETAQDVVTVSGGTALDPVTLEDIYQYAVANSWDLNATINKVSYGPMGADFVDTYGSSLASTTIGRATYLLNMKRLRIEDYWTVSNCNVINFSRSIGPNAVTHYLTMGEYNSAKDLASNGVDWTNVLHSSQFGTVSLHNAKIYDTRVRGRFLRSSSSVAYANGWGLNASVGDSWKVIDTDVSGNFDRGMSIGTSTTDCVVKRVRNYANRWETNSSVGMLGTYSDWTLYPLGTSGPWLRTDLAGAEFDVRNMVIRSNVGTGQPLYASYNYSGGSSFTKLRMINPYMDDWDRGYWFTQGIMTTDIAYVKRAYSVNALLVDKTGTALSGVTVKCYDKDSNLIFSADTVAGVLPEQIVTYKEYRPSTTATTSHYFTAGRTATYSPFRLEFSKTGYETHEINDPIDGALDLVVTLKIAHNQLETLDGDVVSLQQPQLGTDSETIVI